MSSHHIKILTDANFQAEVLSSDKPTLVDFWATWCAPCRAIAPAVESLATQFEGKLNVGKMDIDHSPSTPTKYDVRSIPTLLVFHKGKVIGQLVGAAPKPKIEQFVKDALAKTAAH
ncbi:MAG TPA: thioredoxin [Pseudomonadota bacterium]|jgi:thioredoxin 1|nr:thioredoxin [Pseudomonadota bacterium]HNF98659.1 thioredoxin [Pseudomonadota bacterium]HNI61090.1 thioredoxin [Pseudomonadota bacterium]HNK43257.1 thioredoxin [Pseudomonadota bacterium]HNN50028.1 thioredoxin [Pseudomonadota bacterium]